MRGGSRFFSEEVYALPLPLRVMGSSYLPGCACFTLGLFLTLFFFPAALLAQPAEVNQTAAGGNRSERRGLTSGRRMHAVLSAGIIS